MARNDPLIFDPIAEARRQWTSRGFAASSAMVATTSIMRAHQIVQRAVDEALARFDLTFARYEALTLISFSRAGELPLGKMGDRLMVHPASVTNAIDRLERQGLVERRRSAADRRTVLAVITDAGRRVAEEATAALGEIEYGAGALNESERAALYDIIKVLRTAEGDFIAGAGALADEVANDAAPNRESTGDSLDI